MHVSLQNGICVDFGDGRRATWSIRPDEPKPYIHPLTLKGEAVTLSSPHDHIHHRAIMLAWKAGGINFWEERPKEDCGYQQTVAVSEISVRKDRVRFELDIHWKAMADDRLVLTEKRSFTAVPTGDDGLLITWSSEFTPNGASIELSGEQPHTEISYYGLGVRFARALDWGGTHVNSEGKKQDETLGARAAWHDYTARQDGSHTAMGITLFDHPDNPRHPTEWFTMSKPFVYVTASLLATQKYVIEKGDTLRLTYGIWAHLDHQPAATIRSVYERFVRDSRPGID